MTGLLAFDADQHLGSIAPLAIQRGVRIFLPYYKLFSPADRDAIFAAGNAAGVEVGIIPIFEVAAEQALGGSDQGAKDGARVAAYMAAVGQPIGTAWCLTFDFDEQAVQDTICYAYAKAAVAGAPAGSFMVAYGNGAIAEGLKSAGIAKFAWDAGGMGMRGTRADVTAGNEDIQQDVGDVRGLHLGIEIDSDFAPHANSPADLCAWTVGSVPGAPIVVAPPPPSTQPAQPTDPVSVILTAQSFTQAVREFQGAHGLQADGVIGRNTLRALWGK